VTQPLRGMGGSDLQTCLRISDIAFDGALWHGRAAKALDSANSQNVIMFDQEATS